MLGELFSIIAPVFLIAGFGFLWGRQGRPYDTELVTALVTNFGTPCLIFHTLTSTGLDFEAFGVMGGAAVAAIAAFAAIAWPILRLGGLSSQAFLPSMMLPNAGNMGLPLCLLAFGERGLALAIAYFTVCAVAQFTAGVAIASGSASPGRLLRMPLIYAVAAALVFLATQSAPPAWLANTTRILGGMTIPLMLFTLGISLSRLGVRSLPRSLGLSVLRLVMGFAVGLGLATLFGFEGAARGVLIVQSSMPVAVFNYLFAQRYKTAPEEVAGMVVLSTTIGFALLPALLWFVL